MLHGLCLRNTRRASASAESGTHVLKRCANRLPSSGARASDCHAAPRDDFMRGACA